MPNHPNRNWRARMRSSFERWFAELQQLRGVREPMRDIISTAYTAGYIDGRKSIKKRSRTATSPV